MSRYIPFWARRLGERPAIVCGDNVLTWHDLERDSAALAAFLRDRGVGRGDRLGCLLGNSIPWCIGFYASLRLGAVFVPLNPLFGGFELAQIAADADLSAVLSSPGQIAKIDDRFAATADETPRLYMFGDRSDHDYCDAVAEGRGRTWLDGGLPDSDLLAICYTSGTTGVPKGAMLTHRNVETACHGIVAHSGLRAGSERFLILAPLAFTGGVISNLAPLLVVGGTGFVEKSVDPARTLDLLTHHRITGVTMVPALYERLAAAPGFVDADLSHLRTAITGGAPVPRPLLETFVAKGVAIRQQYGFTEACGGILAPDDQSATRNPGACGYALPSMDVIVANERGEMTDIGEVGEIRARGDQMMAGYWRKPDLTDASFDGDWYLTGDLAAYDEDGAIRIVDRKKNMLISGGVNVYPAEVERAMQTIDGVIEVVVLGMHSDRWGEAVAAIVHGPAEADFPAIQARCRELVGPYKTPKHIVASTKPLPKTPSGKIARTGLGDLLAGLRAKEDASLTR